MPVQLHAWLMTAALVVDLQQGSARSSRKIRSALSEGSDWHVAASLLCHHYAVRTGSTVRSGDGLRRVEERVWVLPAGRGGPDVPRSQFLLLHQSRLPSLGRSAPHVGGFKPGQLAGVACHARRGLSQLPSCASAGLPQRAPLVQFRPLQVVHLLAVVDRAGMESLSDAAGAYPLSGVGGL